jgi:hypothetical protein
MASEEIVNKQFCHIRDDELTAVTHGTYTVVTH